MEPNLPRPDVSYLYAPDYNDPIPSGVYAIVNMVTDTVYVGSTTDFNRRNGQHFAALEQGMHGNRNLQHAYDSYGPVVFSFIVLERCAADPNTLDTIEERWLRRIRKHTVTYNGTTFVHRAGLTVPQEPTSWE